MFGPHQLGRGACVEKSGFLPGCRRRPLGTAPLPGCGFLRGPAGTREAWAAPCFCPPGAVCCVGRYRMYTLEPCVSRGCECGALGARVASGCQMLSSKSLLHGTVVDRCAHALRRPSSVRGSAHDSRSRLGTSQKCSSAGLGDSCRGLWCLFLTVCREELPGQ